MQNFGQIMPRECEVMLYQRHCERSEAIHVSACRAMDCFAALAMTRKGRCVWVPAPDAQLRIRAGTTL